MKLLRVGAPGSEIPAVLMGDGLFLDVSVGGDFTEEFFRSGKLAQLPALVDQLLADGAQPQPLSGQRIGAPIGRPHQIVCIGLNYADHAAETGQDIPSEPIIFTKSPNTLVGPNDSIRLPKNSHKTCLLYTSPSPRD